MIEQTLLRNFAAAETVAQSAGEDKTWRWREGTVLFPEAICPFCRETIKSNRIWLIEGNYVLRGQLRLQRVGNQYGTSRSLRAVFEEPCHPHVSDGSICTGNTDDPVEALFLGLTPSDSFWGDDGPDSKDEWNRWLRQMFDHLCKSIGDYFDGTGECDCEVCHAHF